MSNRIALRPSLAARRASCDACRAAVLAVRRASFFSEFSPRIASSTALLILPMSRSGRGIWSSTLPANDAAWPAVRAACAAPSFPCKSPSLPCSSANLACMEAMAAGSGAGGARGGIGGIGGGMWGAEADAVSRTARSRESACSAVILPSRSIFKIKMLSSLIKQPPGWV